MVVQLFLSGAALHSARRPAQLQQRPPALHARLVARPPQPVLRRCRAQSEGAEPLLPSQVASVQLPKVRRSALLAFTCDKCGQRSERRVNPEAAARGTLFVQCANSACAVWHKISDAYGFMGEEVVYKKQESQESSSE